MIFLPSIVVLLFSFYYLSSHNNTINNGHQDFRYFEFTLPYIKLTSQIAEERGKLTGNLNSDSKLQVGKLEGVFKQTKQVIFDLPELSKQQQNTKLNKKIELINTRLLQLEKHRENSLKKKQTLKQQQAVFDYYSSLNELIISLLSDFREMAENDYLSKKISVLYESVSMKEFFSLERGLVLNLIKKHQMTEQQHSQLVAYRYLQQRIKRSLPYYSEAVLPPQNKEVIISIEKIRSEVLADSLRAEYINSIHSIIGYGGLIHVFKNYILSKDEKYFKQFKSKLLNLTNLYNTIFSDARLTEETKQELVSVLSTFQEYNRKIDFAKQQFLKQSEYIDSLIKVNDVPALESISKIVHKTTDISAEKWWELATTNIDYIDQEIDKLYSAIEKTHKEYIKGLVRERDILLLLILVIFLVAAYIINSILKDSSANLSILFKNMQLLRTPEENTILQKPKTQDELGRLITVLNKHVEENRLIIKNMVIFESVFKTIKQMVMITDHNHKILFVNKSFENQTGYVLANIQGQHSMFLYSDQTTDNLNRKVFRKLQKEGYFRGEFTYQRADGHDFPVDCNITVLKNKQQEVESYIYIFDDITEQVERDKYTWEQLNIDNLTGLYNRQYLIKRLKKDIELSKRNNLKMALLFIDLDGFKLVNDTLGHLAGDMVLFHVAKILQKYRREEDIVARLAGDEFVIVFNGIESVQAIDQITQKLLTAISKPIPVNNQMVTVTCSIGISIFPTDSESVEQLVQHADTAMYSAKDLGKNRLQFYEKQMQERVLNMANTHRELLLAVKNNELRLFYQPIIDLKTSQIVGAESLIRWQHPIKGLIFPDSFISIAEEMGSIVQVGEWVIEECLRQGLEWNDSKLITDDFNLNVNVSSRQCLDGFQKLTQQLTGVSQQLKDKQYQNFIQLEFTESILFNDDLKLREKINVIKSLGFDLLIDDFGTGFSSLSYLKKFPMSKLKIDRAFVKDLEEDKEDRSLVTAIISMAHALEIEVVAEGIETQYQYDFLRKLNCEFGQGYLYSKPLSSGEFEQFILANN